jgi:hypothetical protein
LTSETVVVKKANHLLGGGLLGEEDGVDVGENTAGRDGDASEQLVELLIVLDGQGDVAGDDAALLVVAGGVAGELEDLGGEVLEDGGEVDAGTDSDALGVAALLQVASDTRDGELESRLGGGANGLAGSTSSLSLSSGSSLSLSCCCVWEM